MNPLKYLENIDKNYLLIFLVILIGFVIVDCNTKMFSNLMEGNANNGNINGNKNINSCGSGHGNPQQSPENSAKTNCSNGGNNSSNNSGNNSGKLPQGLIEGEQLYVSIAGPLGREIPKTLQNDYNTLKSFGLTKLSDVVNYLPSQGPAQFQKGGNNVNGNNVRNNVNGNNVNANNISGNNVNGNNVNANNVNRNNVNGNNVNGNVNRNNVNANNVNRNNGNGNNVNGNNISGNNVNGNNVNANNGNNSKEWIVYGSASCGWTKKQVAYMDSKKISYEYVECKSGEGRCEGISGFPTLENTKTGVKSSGYKEM